MQHVLRAISGPQAGAVYVLGSRTTIGRASDCEIQILHDGVSRHHAKLTHEEDGTVSIADLSSDNGTFIEEQRIERHVLAAGEVIRIMRSRFAYEVLQADDAVTSALFRRKVTSGDSLRKTIVYDKPLTTVRAGAVSGLGGVAGERARPYSRPQAAAPALSGARPGAAASGRFGDDVAVPATAPPVGDEPPPAQDSAAFVRERWPDRLGRGAAPPHDSRPASTSHVSRRSGMPGSALLRGSERRAGAAASETAPTRPGSYGWHAEAGHGRRERITAVPTTLAPSGEAAPAAVARVERGPSPLPPSGPSGRMSSLAPTGPEVGSDALPVAGAVPVATAPAAPQGGGWIRVPRTLDTPGSMRPGSTLAGVPRIDAESEAMPTSPPPSAASASARKSITAEYGTLAERGAPASEPAAPGVEPAAPTMVDAAAASVPAADPDAELDAMTTVPSVRRPVARHGSVTPTEKVPRIRGRPAVASALGDDDDPYETRPRATVPPREPSAHAVAPPARAPAAAPVEPASLPRLTTVPDARAGARAIGLARLVDILEYRELRLRALRGEPGDARATERRVALEQLLQQQRPCGGDERAALRRYHRFGCSIAAQLTHHPGGPPRTAAVEIEDLSAGGAKVTFGEPTITSGETVWLAIALPPAARARIPHPEADLVVIQARVVWAQPHAAKLGLVFAGAPRYDVVAAGPLA